ncbi:putative glutaredoxin-C12 [Bienertia sinuspersici]
MERLKYLARTKAAVIFSKSTDCMCHSIKTLIYELGASPEIYELDHDPSGSEREWAIKHYLGCSPTAPAVFIGGKYMGSAGDVFTALLKWFSQREAHAGKSYLASAPYCP